jgi:protein SCO1/2
MQINSHETSSARNSVFGRRDALRALLLPAGAAILSGCASNPIQTAIAPDPIPEGRGKTSFAPDGTRIFRNHRLVDQDGKVVYFFDDLIKGQIFAASFGYATCKGVCTQIASSMGDASEMISPIMANPVRFYTFSLAEDSPEQMREAMIVRGLYGRPGWRYLSGSAEAIRDIRWAFGFAEPDERIDMSLAAHTGMARFGYHAIDKWSSCPAMGSPVNIARSVVSLFPPTDRPRFPALDYDGSNGARESPGFRGVQPLIAMR